jgi:hypothetical protein
MARASPQKRREHEKHLHSVFAVDFSARCGAADVFQLNIDGGWAEYKFVHNGASTGAPASQSLPDAMWVGISQMPTGSRR